MAAFPTAISMAFLVRPARSGARCRSGMQCRQERRQAAVWTVLPTPHPEVLAEGEPRRTQPCRRSLGRGACFEAAAARRHLSMRRAVGVRGGSTRPLRRLGADLARHRQGGVGAVEELDRDEDELGVAGVLEVVDLELARSVALVLRLAGEVALLD